MPAHDSGPGARLQRALADWREATASTTPRTALAVALATTDHATQTLQLDPLDDHQAHRLAAVLSVDTAVVLAHRAATE